MTEPGPTSEMTKSWSFFEKAHKAGEAGNFDYAIDMYLEGLRLVPEEIVDGHNRLRALALMRKEKGGKGPSMMEKVKAMRHSRSPLEQMLNCEYLFTKDPENLSHAEAMLKAAIEGKYNQTARWVADMLFQLNTSSGRPSVRTYVLLKDSYSQIGEFDRALAACQYAVKMRPQDGNLSDEFKRLSAELTMVRGKYDQEGGDFRKSMKDRDVQEKLQSQEGIVKTEDYRIKAINEARSQLASEPGVPGHIFNLAQVLVDMEEDKFDNEAIELLEKAFAEKKDFSFKDRAGQIKIKQIGRKLRHAKAALEEKKDAALQTAVEQIEKQLNEAKLEHYRLCVLNYPTDLHVKYEYANCLLQNKQCDEAIPLFQDASRDPRHKIPAMSKIGLCFYIKGWFADAIDIYNQAIDSYEIKDDSVAKEMRYNLGRSFEAKGDTEKALDIYRKIAQLDFGYKDVRQRVDALRKKPQGS